MYNMKNCDQLCNPLPYLNAFLTLERSQWTVYYNLYIDCLTDKHSSELELID